MAAKPKKAQPRIVSEPEWRRAVARLLVREKAATRAGDALAPARRRQPRVAIDQPYRFQGPHGAVSLPDLFEGRRQLLLDHFRYAPT